MSVCRPKKDADHSLDDFLRSAGDGDTIATDILWESLGPDAIDDWYENGRSRETKRIADILLARDSDALGEILMHRALEYIDRHVHRDTSPFI